MDYHEESGKRLGQAIQQAREAKKLSLQQVSDLTGIPRLTIHRMEGGGVAHPRADILNSLAHALDIPVSDLYALAGYTIAGDLPSLLPYLQAKYPNLSGRALIELDVYFTELAAREGVNLDGPPDHDDEKK